MTSEKITVSADVQDLQKALDEAKSFSARSGLRDRQALHLDLLVEETLGMVRAMVSEFQGEIYYENEQSVYRIHLQAKAQVSTQKRRELVSLSTSGKNAAVKGLMSRIGIFLSSAGDSIDEYGAETLNYGIMPIGEIDLPVGVYDMTPLWTLSNYKKVLGQQRADSENAREAWDELEKSIVANIADDVVVGVSRGHIEMIISKDFSKATLPMRERVSSVETPKLWITQNERRVSVANEMAQTFAWHVGLTPRESMHITLLTEETIGMVRAMAREFEGQLWIEGDNIEARIHLEAEAHMGEEEKQKLIAASTAGKNAAPKGFMAKIGTMIANAFKIEPGDELEAYLYDEMPEYMHYGMLGIGMTEPLQMRDWSLMRYRAAYANEVKKHHSQEANDALDELESSIVGRLADDVTVGIRGNKVEMVIYKRFAREK